MKIVVLAGGLSPERDVSLSSGALIANALMAGGHTVLVTDLYLGHPDAAGFEAAHARHGRAQYAYAVPAQEPDLLRLQKESGNGKALIGPNVLAVCADADLVFLALHGGMGENGQLQAVLDSFGILYTGTGYTGSLLAMDKAVSKELMRYHGVPTADWTLLELAAPEAGQRALAFGLPMVVKPVGCGSSVGVSLVDDEAQLATALEHAARYEGQALLERRITGREFSVGVLGGAALPVIEMVPTAGFYDYQSKYQPGLTREDCPAELPPETAARLQQLALQVHRVLRLGDYARIDFMMDEKGRAFCLEANTLPGMTPTSLLPQEARAAGISYEALCQRIVELAVRRQ